MMDKDKAYDELLKVFGPDPNPPAPLPPTHSGQCSHCGAKVTGMRYTVEPGEEFKYGMVSVKEADRLQYVELAPCYHQFAFWAYKVDQDTNMVTWTFSDFIR